MPGATKARILKPLFHNRKVTPACSWAVEFPLNAYFIGFSRSYGVRESLFLDSVTRETHQRQPTLGLWPARSRRVGSAFEDTEFSGAKQPSKETTDVFSCRNAMRWCPPVVGHRTMHGALCHATCSLALAARPQDRLNISWNSPIPHIPEVLNATYRTRPPLTTSMDRLRKTSVEACNLIATILTLR
jgi:hypothetical protein